MPTIREEFAMKSLISKTAKVVAFVASMTITSLMLYVHMVDREHLGARPAVASTAADRPIA